MYLIAWTIASSPGLDHLDLNYSRSWFQTPNTYDNLNVENVVSGGTSANPVFGNVGDADQHSKIGTINISPTYTRVISDNSVFNIGAFVAERSTTTIPSGNPLADLGPANLQTSSIAQDRTLTNSAVHRISRMRRVFTPSRRARSTDRPSCTRTTTSASSIRPTHSARHAWIRMAIRCRDIRSRRNADGAARQNPSYLPVLAPYDLTRGGSYYAFVGHTDVKELGAVCRGSDQSRQLALEPGAARRHLQRSDGRQPDAAARGHCL